jgi:hypothetical protein
MSRQVNLRTFRDNALSLSQVIAELTGVLITMEPGDPLHIILPSLKDEQFQKWRYAVLALCKQWEARISDGKVMLYMIKRKDGRHECLYEAEFDILK